MKVLILTSALVLGGAFAHASVAEGQKQTTIQGMIALAKAPVQMSVKGEAPTTTKSICNEKGEQCYPDDSAACCSGLCVDMACD